MKEDIHVRLSEDLMRSVRAYATSRGISLAAAVSVLLRRALEGESS
jgi:predicted DNA binding CopG/RHH family protein